MHTELKNFNCIAITLTGEKHVVLKNRYVYEIMKITKLKLLLIF